MTIDRHLSLPLKDFQILSISVGEGVVLNFENNPVLLTTTVSNNDFKIKCYQGLVAWENKILCWSGFWLIPDTSSDIKLIKHRQCWSCLVSRDFLSIFLQNALQLFLARREQSERTTFKSWQKIVETFVPQVLLIFLESPLNHTFAKIWSKYVWIKRT